jgi:hypothetical protein
LQVKRDIAEGTDEYVHQVLVNEAHSETARNVVGLIIKSKGSNSFVRRIAAGAEASI